LSEIRVTSKIHLFGKITNVHTYTILQWTRWARVAGGCRDARNRNCNYAELRHSGGGFRRVASRRDSSRHAWHTRQLTLIYISERDFGPSVLYRHSRQLGESIRTLSYFLLELLIQLPMNSRTNYSLQVKRKCTIIFKVK